MPRSSNYRQMYLTTFTGKRLFYDAPTADAIDIKDIAHAMAMIPRFGGHTKIPYSVAQHSCHVAEIVPGIHRKKALMHDSPEAYLGDMVTPLKRIMKECYPVENHLWAVICAKFGMDHHMPEEVKAADAILLALEARDLMGVNPNDWGLDTPPERYGVVPWDREFAEAKFLERFREYFGGDEYSRALAAQTAPVIP